MLNFERDFDTVRVLGKGKRYDNRRKVIYDEKFEEYLKSKACLKRWAHMPIGNRIMRIRKVKGVEVSKLVCLCSVAQKETSKMNAGSRSEHALGNVQCIRRGTMPRTRRDAMTNYSADGRLWK